MQLVLISGLSGSGKSVALNVLEDSGYYCVDNLPVALVVPLLEALAGSGHELVALSMDARSGASVQELPQAVAALKQKGVIRATGVSCHDLGALKAAAAHPWVDVIFARINYKGGKDYAMDGSVEEVSAVLKQARANGIKAGLIRPISLWPFPSKIIGDACGEKKKFLVVEMSSGQMVEDVMLAVNGRSKVDFYGRYGGGIPTVEEIILRIEALV